MVSNTSEMKSYLGWKIDYSSPKGEPGFAAPGSVAWQVYKNQVALGIGGIAAVLLEFADARIRSGVWDHSTYKVDPIGRSERTGIAAMVGVYGPQSAARRVIQGVTNMHTKVQGNTPKGDAYKALDVELLDWVSATAAYGFMTAYHRFVRPLSDAEQKSFLEGGHGTARLYGVQNPISSLDDFNAMLAKLEPRFEPHPINSEFLEIVKTRAQGKAPKAAGSALVNAAVSILPPSVRATLELGPEYDLTWKGRMFVRFLGKMADRKVDLNSPAAQAAERLGLPRDFVWKSKSERDRLLEGAEIGQPVEA